MSDYTITTDFGAKDSLPSGNAAKIIKGSEFTTEFTNIKTAVNTKADTTGDTFTGAVTFDAAVTVNSTATITGDLTVDTNTLFVDVSENRVGIGTDNPEAKLEVDGAKNDNLLILEGAADNFEFHVTSGDAATANSSLYRLALERNGTDNGFIDFYRGGDGTDGYLTFGSSNTERMRIDSTGNVGIGETDPDTELHISAAFPKILLQDTDGTNQYGEFYHSNGTTAISARNNATNGSISFQRYDGTTATTSMRIDTSGNVGIGTTSPAKTLHISDGTNNTPTTFRIENTDTVIAEDQEVNSVEFYTNDSSTSGTGVTAKIAQVAENPGNQYGLAFSTYDVGLEEAMRIDESGKVGIGTASPSTNLHVAGGSSGTNQALFRTSSGGGGGLQIVCSDLSLANPLWSINTFFGETLAFGDGTSEHMRIDSSGNVLVGTTVTNSTAISSGGTTTGVEFQPNGELQIGSDGDKCAIFNRQSSDGEILRFRKDGSTVGSIGNTTTSLFIGSGDVGLRFDGADNRIRPVGNASNLGSARDDAIDLGDSGARFDDIYATNGAIQTSDRNEKQGIRELLDAEQRVATACKGLLRAFKWNSAVEEKGDEARIHFGIIAQDLQDAFTAEGLDASDYAMFINSTWTDEETGEERSRMGVRYSELLAFIISAI